MDICGGAYLFSEDTKTWYNFSIRIRYYPHVDAVGECELCFSHLLQVRKMVKRFTLDSQVNGPILYLESLCE